VSFNRAKEIGGPRADSDQCHIGGVRQSNRERRLTAILAPGGDHQARQDLYVDYPQSRHPMTVRAPPPYALPIPREATAVALEE
jgi:hypothetical protein